MSNRTYVLLPSGPRLHSGLLLVRHRAQTLTTLIVSEVLLYLLGTMSAILDMEDCKVCVSNIFLLFSVICVGFSIC
jgi:hypothetical protein